jgi:signal transduction histidine kinase
VRLRLTLWYVALLGAALLVFGGAVYALGVRRADVDLQLQIQSDAEGLAKTFNPADGRLHPEAASAGAPILVDGRDHALFVTPSGAVSQEIGHVGTPRLEQLWLVGKELAIGPERFAVVATSGGAAAGATLDYLVYATPVRSDGKSLGWLVLAVPRTNIRETQGLLLAFVIVGALTLIASAGGGYWLAGRAMRPVQTITRAAAEIDQAGLGHRLNLDVDDELGELARTFDGMLDRLEHAFARERQFTGDASHELRTPLSIIDLETARALAEPRSPDDYRRALTNIRSENERIIRIVNALLTLARADDSRPQIQSEAVDLSDITLDVVERLVPLARQANVLLDVGELPELVVRGDRVLLGQMVGNLVENAIVYTSGVGRRVRVSVDERQAGSPHLYRVRIEDDGPGISAADLPRIFDRFYRADRARRIVRASVGADLDADHEYGPPGAGLGLAIARWIARCHGGDIEVSSVVGRGSSFEVLLPAP